MPHQFRDDGPLLRRHNLPRRKEGNERVTGRKARDLQTEETGCTGQTLFISRLSGRRRQTTSARFLASLVAQLVKNPPARRETPVQSLGWEDPLEKGKATHSSTLAWRIPWTL